jgi:lysophospholipase L1-like esterase
VTTIILLQLVLAIAAQAEAPWPDPERFRTAIEAFESEDREAPPPSGAIVGTGSSSMRFWSVGDRFASDLSPLTVINRGFGGSVIHDVETFLEPLVLRHQPRAVLIYEGDNDVAEGVPIQEILASYDRVQSRLDQLAVPPRVYWLAVKPSLARWSLWPQMQAVNDGLKERARQHPRITFVDVATPMLNEKGMPREDIFIADGLHMNAKGYDLWREALRPVLLPAELEFERAPYCPCCASIPQDSFCK